jgi:hypothetical protein
MKKMILLLLFSLAAAQAALDTLFCQEVDIESIEEYRDLLLYGCSLGCAIGWEYSASSVLEPQGDNTYIPANLADCDFETAWVEGVDGYGIGEEIIINFQMDENIHDMNFDGIDIINGYTKTPATWINNTRVKTFRVWHNSEPVFCIELLDTDRPQTVSFIQGHTIYLDPGDIVYLEIIDIYPGDKYEDTAITEINLYGDH